MNIQKPDIKELKYLNLWTDKIKFEKYENGKMVDASYSYEDCMKVSKIKQ